MTSEALNPNVRFIYNEETSGAIPTDVTHVRVDPSVKEIHAEAFAYSRSLVEVEFSEGLECIGKEAFYHCDDLKHINRLPSTLKEIHDCAFSWCQSLDSVEFPEGLQVIGASAFQYCLGLKTIKIPSAHVLIESYAFCACSRLISVELPEGLQVIGEAWFAGCSSLTTVNVPSSVIEIQQEAFAYCTSLTSVDLREALQSIEGESFAGCTSLESIHIPSTVCKMGTGVFRHCSGLRSITLPQTLEIIEGGMFSNCTSLTHIEIPLTVTKIEERAFSNCENLTHVRIPSSVTIIEWAVFANCTRLISLELPEALDIFDLEGSDDSDSELPRHIHGCRSLVNLIIPSDQQYRDLLDEEFLEDLKLRHVATNFEDLFRKLQHRFDALPVHRLCYYQSYYSLTEAMENLRQSMDLDLLAGTKEDFLGMTPFHILALSQTPDLSLFQALLKVYKVDMIHAKDNFGSTPMDYLCLNHTPDSAMVIQSLLQTTIAERLQWLGLDQWKLDISTLQTIAAQRFQWLGKLDISSAMNDALAVEWTSGQCAIGLLYFKFATYERLESMSLLELALWKVKMDGCKVAGDTDHERDEGRNPKRSRLEKLQLDVVDRQNCRINSGADVVISNVLPFLEKVCRKDYVVGG